MELYKVLLWFDIEQFMEQWHPNCSHIHIKNPLYGISIIEHRMILATKLC